jgi:pyridoxamine 5'-phosphate oxidase
MDREQARQRELRRATAGDDPFALFGQWYEEACGEGLVLPEAMTLATCGEDRQPQARVVLLKDYDERGFTFYTNYRSDKARELEENPNAVLNFWWAPLERQIRIVGRAEMVSPEESQAYFATRPRDSQIGAWASDQSCGVESRAMLEARMHEIEQQYDGKEVPCPAHWGGYRVVPAKIEFWQGRPGRLHDRLLYERRDDGRWSVSRLCP